ncbi:hypothetical protein GCM10009864_38920 [Streptomyces lunalinharesii]|uniref:Uncharacterized protein n=1 Tax=Streptomyces lunalinharesii TaxID=333384 RepID=A0ABP6EJ10_9ACTN
MQDVKRSSPAHHPRRPDTATQTPRAADNARRRRNGGKPHNVGPGQRRQAQTATTTAGKPKTWEANRYRTRSSVATADAPAVTVS